MSTNGAPQDPALVAQQPLPTQAALEPNAIEWMLICFAQDQQLFAEARTLIAAHHFLAKEAPLQLVYEAMCQSKDQFGGITYETVSDLAAGMLQQNQSLILTQEQQQIIFRPDEYGLIFQICEPGGVEMNDTNRNFARTLLQRFAQERTVIEPLRRVVNPAFNVGVPDLSSFLDVLTRQQSRLATLQNLPLVDVVPQVGTPLQQSYVFKQTGVSFIDGPLGGQREGDCNGIIGPTGGGKTTLAIQLAVAAAKQSWAESQRLSKPPGLVVYMTVEEAAIKLRPRIWSAFFNIPRTKLETLADWGQLTQPGQLDPYELLMQADQERKLSEIERYQAYGPQLAQCFRLVDLSGSDAHPNAGSGFIPEMVSVLSRFDAPIDMVLLDYAGLSCARHMHAMGKADQTYYRSLLKNFGDMMRKEISERFRCTTWVLHQLKGEAGSASPFKLMHHTDAGESKDFAENMAVCGCLGVPDPHTGCRRFNWSKCRYRPNEQIAPPTLRINEKFAYMEDVTEVFAIDEGGRQFVTREDLQQVHGAEHATRRVQSGPAGLRRTDHPASLAGVTEE